MTRPWIWAIPSYCTVYVPKAASDFPTLRLRQDAPKVRILHSEMQPQIFYYQDRGLAAVGTGTIFPIHDFRDRIDAQFSSRFFLQSKQDPIPWI